LNHASFVYAVNEALLSESCQKEILKYLDCLETEEALLRNIDKVIQQLKDLQNKSGL